MDVLKKLLTAVRGGARELGEVLVENQGERIFEQELIEVEKSMRMAKQTLTEVMAREMLAQREIRQGVADVKALEADITASIEAGEDDHAATMAKQLIGLETDLERQQLHHRGLKVQVNELRDLVERAERQYKEHQRQLTMLRTTEKVHQVTQAVHDRFDASVLSTQSALDRIKKRREAVAARIDVESQIRQLSELSSAPDGKHQERQVEAVESVLKRLQPGNSDDHDQG